MDTPQFKNILFLGMGGGNDVFSTLLAAKSLWNIGWRWQEAFLGGVLSPFHEYTDLIDYGYGAWWTRPESTRFLVRMHERRKISFVDAKVAELVRENRPLNISGVLGFSLEEGSIGMADALMHARDNFDYVVLVDVGGDCFYRGAQDTHVISPMFDSMVLRGFLDSGKPGILFEAGPGTDGEMDPEVLQDILRQASAVPFPLKPGVMDWWAQNYRIWIAPVRTGNTVPRTIEAFASGEKEVQYPHRVRAHMGSTRLYTSFTQRVWPALCKYFYLVKPEAIHNPFAVECRFPEDWFIQTQVHQHRTCCEANLEYTRIMGKQCQFLTPAPLFPLADQQAIIAQGLQELEQGICDAALMFPRDWETVTLERRNQFWVLSQPGLRGLAWVQPKRRL